MKECALIVLFKIDVKLYMHSLKSNIYYSILVNTKFHYPLYESLWRKSLFLENKDFNCEKYLTVKLNKCMKTLSNISI